MIYEYPRIIRVNLVGMADQWIREPSRSEWSGRDTSMFKVSWPSSILFFARVCIAIVLACVIVI